MAHARGMGLEARGVSLLSQLRWLLSRQREKREEFRMKKEGKNVSFLFVSLRCAGAANW